MAYLHANLCQQGVDMKWGGETEKDDIMQKAIALMKARRR